MPDMNSRLNSQRRSLFRELPYYGQNVILAHGQFNNCLSCHLLSKKYLETLCSIYDLDLFSLNTSEAHNPDLTSIITTYRVVIFLHITSIYSKLNFPDMLITHVSP